ncbi:MULTISPECIES: DUF934 domain-containing protein [Agrobacterium tumefaciens complex]|jgi:uncharacterized protein (DUF934 family)|uniref:DUF934 domain-containing protein n=1 Tax=Agrobacterium tumefaciens TaxID=358 RepID=UPI000FE29C0B|nr:DUF934 domain-containing protein [Agrobacterium tumefaciens]QAB00903.1 hypothetical protein DC439_24105 [Agrobacterium tumefaciens]
MALINNLRQVIEDRWTYPDPEGSSAIKPNCVLPLGALTSLESDPLALRPVGVYAPAGTTGDGLAPFLKRLDLVVVEFPKFRDGRGFTLARTLREKYNFKGDIRAIGYILPDQFSALVRCGFSSFLLPANHPSEQWSQSTPAAAHHTAGRPLLQRLLAGQPATADKTGV